MVDGGACVSGINAIEVTCQVASVAVIGGAPQNPLPESEMDALLLGRTRVSFYCFFLFFCNNVMSVI